MCFYVTHSHLPPIMFVLRNAQARVWRVCPRVGHDARERRFGQQKKKQAYVVRCGARGGDSCGLAEQCEDAFEAVQHEVPHVNYK
jgi:hypothetical protein